MSFSPMTADRVVVDTSILISAALSPSGKPAEVVEVILASGVLIFSQSTFEELATRLQRSKFDKYLQPGDRELFLSKLSAVGNWVEIVGGLRVCRDPNDDKILETAITASASCIVTGDQDLLVLDAFQHIPILTAAAFLERVVP